MNDFYPFDQPIYQIPSETLPELTKNLADHVKRMHFRQILIGPLAEDPAPEVWSNLVQSAESFGLSLLFALSVRPEDTQDSLIGRAKHYPGSTAVLLYLFREETTAGQADQLMDALSEACDLAVAARFLSLPEGEDEIPEGTCLFPFYRIAYRRHALAARRLQLRTYCELLDAMQEADHLMTAGSLIDGICGLLAADCEKFRALPLKALMMLQMTLTGTPLLIQGEEFGLSEHRMPDTVRPKGDAFTPDPDWIQLEDADSLYAFVRDLVALREEIPALACGGYQLLTLDRAFAFARMDEDAGQAVIVAVNLGASRVRMPGSADVILSSCNRSFFDGTLLPYEAVILEAFPPDEDEEEETE